jgi:hypothetical protein
MPKTLYSPPPKPSLKPLITCNTKQITLTDTSIIDVCQVSILTYTPEAQHGPRHVYKSMEFEEMNKKGQNPKSVLEAIPEGRRNTTKGGVIKDTLLRYKHRMYEQWDSVIRLENERAK